jgi:tRNA pseudouridine55 synthase
LDLDVAGKVTRTAPYNHVTLQAIKDALPEFIGSIMQVPPIFGAIRKGGKKMYEVAREGKTAENLKMDAREVDIAWS